MKRIVMLGMALLAVVAIGGASAISVSASGHEFIASKLGKTKSKGSGIQVFKASGFLIECSSVTGSGEITELHSTTHKEVLNFSGCSGLGGDVSVSTADFDYNANGPATLEKRVLIAPEGMSCEIVIEPQAVEGPLAYETVSGKLKSNSNVGKVKIKPTSAECGSATEASYSGTINAELLEGGTLEWK
ncbi:MAG TPA: hypothetical protein VK765_02830 [Solirubrobacteraceae bacterium]|jgi:hypothetical protein|nr:hypothetical protein [Solirubrobacteraceae bacterium]